MRAGVHKALAARVMFAGVALATASVRVAAAALSSPGCLAGGEPARVVAVTEELELELADGRRVRLPGIDAVSAGHGASQAATAAREALTRWLQDREVLVEASAVEPDRWGRTLALVFAPGPADAGARVSVAEALLDAGWARAAPDTRVQPCWPTFLALETDARQAGLGLWREADYAVLSPEDRAGLTRSAGGMAIVEGRVARVFAGRARTYVGFDAGGRGGFTLTIERRFAARLRETGTDPSLWNGRRVRVRGFFDDRFGPEIELTSLAQLEFIDP